MCHSRLNSRSCFLIKVGRAGNIGERVGGSRGVRLLDARQESRKDKMDEFNRELQARLIPLTAEIVDRRESLRRHPEKYGAGIEKRIAWHAPS